MFMKQRSPVPMIIGLTHTDCPGAWDAANIALALGYPNPSRRPPVVTVNANETASVAQAVIALVQHTWSGSLAATS
jgi:signal recognition particle receptor subunit beta